MAETTPPAGGDKPAAKAKQVVKYVGTADVREIDAKSWKQVGVEDQDKVVWSRANAWSVADTDLSKGALAYLDKDDDGFVLQDA